MSSICSQTARRILAGPRRIRRSPAQIAVDRFELAIALDRLLHLRRLPVERLRCRSRLRLGEKALRLASALQRTYRSGTVAHRQGLARGNHRKISGHHAPTVKFFAAYGSRSLASSTKAICRNSRDTLADSLVHRGPTQVGITVSGAETVIPTCVGPR